MYDRICVGAATFCTHLNPTLAATALAVKPVPEIDLEALWTSAHGYTVNDEDDDDPVVVQTAPMSRR